MFQFTKPIYARLVASVGIALALGACTPAPAPVDDTDAFGAQNRNVHAFNKGVDRAALRPVSQVYGTVLPQPVRKGVSNFASNLSLPGMVVNNVLQGRVMDAGTNAFRFTFNTVFGIGGLLDIATEAGIPLETTDFGETLYYWGAPEGAYAELPLVGPSTSRHTAGRLVDVFLNPLNLIDTSPAAEIVAGSRAGAGIDYRYESTDLIDGVLYESADSYAQTRLIYLQNRRFALSGESQVEEFDPYEDVYGTE